MTARSHASELAFEECNETPFPGMTQRYNSAPAEGACVPFIKRPHDNTRSTQREQKKQEQRRGQEKRWKGKGKELKEEMYAPAPAAIAGRGRETKRKALIARLVHLGYQPTQIGIRSH